MVFWWLQGGRSYLIHLISLDIRSEIRRKFLIDAESSTYNLFQQLLKMFSTIFIDSQSFLKFFFKKNFLNKQVIEVNRSKFNCSL